MSFYLLALADIHGNAIEYHKDVKHRNAGGVLATLQDHQFYLKSIPQNVRDSLPA